MEEKIRIVAEAMAGDREVKEVARRYGINEATLHRWKVRFPRAPEACALRNAGRHTAYMELLAEMEVAAGGKASVDSVFDPELDHNPPDLDADYLQWEQRKNEQAEAELQERTRASDVPPIAWMSAVRWSPGLVVRVHGNLPREDDVLLQIALPKGLHDRLSRQKEGSLNRVITGLIGYALDQLDEEGATLHVYDRRKQAPVLKEPRVKAIGGLQAKQRFLARRGND
ncbi:transposase [Pseudoxanthomonas jiangsuensis]|uniref:transposase n=1 Tax=Pseudoxanthomonas jiangsuensis TaxID=619688 RepID=UPI001391E9DE|nr:transposase [Pseudoxanthomonas jiangsuensis]